MQNTFGQAGCRHRWLIEAPKGPTSMGRCVHCGIEREFRNSGSRERTLPQAERLLVARRRREEAAVTAAIRKLDGAATLSLAAYRRNVQREDA